MLENIPTNKEALIAAGLIGVTTMVIGVFAGKAWAKRAATKATPAADQPDNKAA